ncbi:hypothetical protein JTE90_004432 [Oedothorax gibbosus]|uniref:Uncharacterized protein n=1 Tax=Oedothorax gibbosus TaxID=931172 RepID=A0AAV6UPA3_9ARAC|nr:hypothetical protein JTE90_004432 [Oedothorax gibbosus]
MKRHLHTKICKKTARMRTLVWHWILLLQLFITTLLPPTQGFETVITEQEVSSLGPRKLIVQILTEPESLIRIFEGLDLSFQMLRHIGRTGPALIRLPFDKEFLSNHYDHVGLDHRKRPFYARMPTMFPHEAPRYIRMPTKDGYYRRQGIFRKRPQLPMFY